MFYRELAIHPLTSVAALEMRSFISDWVASVIVMVAPYVIGLF